MKRIMILMTALLAFALIGCSAETGSAVPAAEALTTTSPSVQRATTTRPIPTKPPSKTMDEKFLDVIHEEGIFKNLTFQAVDLAKSTCETFDAGATLGQVMRIATETMGAGDAGFFIGASIGAYCPKYSYLVNK